MGPENQTSVQNARERTGRPFGQFFLPLVFALGLQNLHDYLLLLNKESPNYLLPHSLVTQYTTIGSKYRYDNLREKRLELMEAIL